MELGNFNAIATGFETAANDSATRLACGKGSCQARELSRGVLSGQRNAFPLVLSQSDRGDRHSLATYFV